MLIILFNFLPFAFAFLPQLNQHEKTDETFSNRPILSPSETMVPWPSTKKGLSTTWIIVIVVSVIIIGSVLITFLVFWIIKKAKTKYGHDLEENLMGNKFDGFHKNS